MGLEREGVDQLSFEMDRLHRSCRRLIWLNPLLRYDGFEARASGIRTMMPFVDEFRPVHSLDSLRDLSAALAGPPGPEHDPKKWLRQVLLVLVPQVLLKPVQLLNGRPKLKEPKR